MGRQQQSYTKPGTDSERFFDTQLLLGAKVSGLKGKELDTGALGTRGRAAMLRVGKAGLLEDGALWVNSSIPFSFISPTSGG